MVHFAQDDDATLRADLKSRKIDETRMDDVAARLQGALKSVNQEALKTLRNAKSILDEAADGMEETRIELDDASARLHALKTLMELPEQHTTKDQLAEIDKLVDGYDFMVNSVKAMLDFVSSPDPVGMAQGLLEIAGADAIKGTLKDKLQKVMNIQTQLVKDVGDVIDGLHAFSQEEAKSEGARQQALRTLASQRSNHYQKALQNFVHDLNSLPPQPGQQISPDVKGVMDTYSQVIKLDAKMRDLMTVLQNSKTLNDKDLMDALNPLGTFDPELTQHVHQLVPTGVVYNVAPLNNLFILPSSMDQAALEKLPGQIEDVMSIKPFAVRVAREAQDWESAMDSGFAPGPE